MKQVLAAVAGLYAHTPFPLLVVGHSLTVSAWFKRAHQDRFLLNYWVVFLAAFGGGTVTALLVQDPSHASISLFTKNALGVYFTLSWWALNYFPGDLVARLHGTLPVQAAARACLCILRAGLIVHRVSTAVALFPGVVAAPLVIGTISGSGGKLLVDAINRVTGEAKGPSELAQPGYSLRSAFLASLAVYVLVHLTQILSEAEGLALVTTVFIVHALAEVLTGIHLDYTEPFARVFHAVTGIPQPGQPSGSRARGPKAKGAVSNPATPAPSATKQVAKPYADDAQNVAINAAAAPAPAGRPAPRAAAHNGVSVPAAPAAAVTPGRVTRRRKAAAAAAGSE